MTAEKKLTLRDLASLYEADKKIVALTAYDTPTARLADESGVHIVLVGDSVGMTTLGYPNTLLVTLEQSLHHTAAVARGVRRALVVGDMPFLSFHMHSDETLRNAGRYIQEARADAVKLEGGRAVALTVARLVECGIPVMGHVGLLPQKVVVDGGYRVHGRTETEAEAIIADARALEDAGAFSVILEGLPQALSARITASVGIPTIGIGAGPHCSGQIQVVHDILGWSEDFNPRHAKRYANLARDIRAAISEYADDVTRGNFPGKDQTTP